MITHHGYTDGSGEYYLIVDSDKCSGCGECIKVCPQGALVLVEEFIDLEDRTVVAVSEGHRKKIRYTCQGCKPETGKTPCVLACRNHAIHCVWKPQ